MLAKASNTFRRVEGAGSMEWAKPEYSKGAVDRAAVTMMDATAPALARYQATLVINNWRASHNYPLNTFKVTLRSKSLEIDPERLVAQRIKRMSSIEAKLTRFAQMKMSRMQDIGGCRAILSTVEQVLALVEKYKHSDLKHTLDDVDDYIANPKASGYRGIHMIYKYFSDKQAPSVYNGLSIEMQLRTRLQHTWATAVETVGTFLSQALKSSQGEEHWLRFFSLMGSVFAMREGTPLVPNTPTTQTELFAQVKQHADLLNVEYVLHAYQQAVKVVREGPEKGDHYYLLVLEPKAGKITIQSYPRRHLDQASSEYLAVEERIADTPGAQAVLVSVDSIASLERAYPNYFLDTAVFLEELRRITAATASTN
jgi:hypothetical protein